MLSLNLLNGEWDGELKFFCIGVGGNFVLKLVGLWFLGIVGGDGKVGGNIELVFVFVKWFVGVIWWFGGFVIGFWDGCFVNIIIMFYLIL